jgi:hypothetical protein
VVLQQVAAKSTLPVAVTFLTGKGDLGKGVQRQAADRQQVRRRSDKVLELTPKKPSAQFKTLVLVVDPSNFRVKKSIVTTAPATPTSSASSSRTPQGGRRHWFVFNPAAAKGFREIKAEEAPQK